MCDHLVIEMKNKGYKPGPASSFFRALCASQVGPGIRPDVTGSFGGGFSAENFRAPWDLCASQVGLGIGPDIRGSFAGGFSAEIFRAPWDQTKKKFHPPCGIHCGSKTYPKRINREERAYANSVVRQYSTLP